MVERVFTWVADLYESRADSLAKRILASLVIPPLAALLAAVLMLWAIWDGAGRRSL